MPNITYNFAGTTALVTGGASGMGASVATLFRNAGADVFIVDANEMLAKEVAQSIGATAIVGDVTDSAFCTNAVQSAARKGNLRAVVNAAGTIARKSGIETEDDIWRRVMTVNASGVFYMSRAAARHLRANSGGSVVNFGSIWGELGGKGALAYCASKGAVHQITRTFALELAREGVRFNCVCPGEVDTPMLRTAGRDKPLTDDEATAMGERVVPLGVLAKPEDVARTVLFLCSDEAHYITGAMYYVDGGYSTI